MNYLIGENFVGENFSSPGKYFVTFPRRKFFPVLFESNYFLTSIIATGTSLVSFLMGSSNVTFSSSFSLISLSSFSFEFLYLMFRNQFLPHLHHLQLNPLRNERIKMFYGKLVYGENLSSLKINHRGK